MLFDRGHTVDGIGVKTEQMGAAGVVRVSGDIDSHNVDQLHDALSTALANATSTLVIDLADVQTLDSSALGALIDADRDGREVGVRVVLVYDDPIVARAIEVSGLDSVFERATSIEAAVDGN